MLRGNDEECQGFGERGRVVSVVCSLVSLRVDDQPGLVVGGMNTLVRNLGDDVSAYWLVTLLCNSRLIVEVRRDHLVCRLLPTDWVP